MAMRVVVFALLIVLSVAFGRLSGWDWWPYLAWPALGIALVVALFSESSKSAAILAATVAFSVWMLIASAYVFTAFNQDIDGREDITSVGEAVWILAQAAVVIGIPLTLGTGAAAALASWAGRRSRSVTR